MHGRGCSAAGMLIRVSIESTRPLAGTAAAEQGGRLHNDGWLELLRVISELVAEATATCETRREGAVATNNGVHPLNAPRRWERGPRKTKARGLATMALRPASGASTMNASKQVPITIGGAQSRSGLRGAPGSW